MNVNNSKPKVSVATPKQGKTIFSVATAI